MADRAATGAALAILAPGPLSGRELRGRLADRGHRFRLVPFYEFMAKLEDAGLVTAWDVDEEIDGVAVKTRWYRC